MKLLLLKLFFLLIPGFLIAQHIAIDKKALSLIASQEKVNVLFSFDSLSFNSDSIPEADFLQTKYVKISEWKDKETAKVWFGLYQEYKNKQWQEAFMTALNEKVKEYKNPPTFIIGDSTATYTMQINSYWMYFGYDVVIGKEPSKVSMVLNFYKTKNPSNILFQTEINRAMGTNNDSYDLKNWPDFRRMSKAYNRAGYKLAQAFNRVID